MKKKMFFLGLCIVLLVVISGCTSQTGQISDSTPQENKKLHETPSIQDKEDVIAKVMDYLNSNVVRVGTEASFVSVEEKNGLYVITTMHQENEISVYATMDGVFLLVATVYDLTEEYGISQIRDDIVANVLDYLNKKIFPPGKLASFLSVKDMGDIYTIMILYDGGQVPIYTTKNGAMLFDGYIYNLDEGPETIQEQPKDENLITKSPSEMLPTRSDTPTQFRMDAPHDVNLDTIPSGFVSGEGISAFKLVGSIVYGAVYIDAVVLKFDSSENAESFYITKMDEIKNLGGYTEVNVPVSWETSCFSWTEDYGFEARFAFSTCQKKNIAFDVTITVQDTYMENPHSHLNTMIQIIDYKAK